MTNRRKRVVRDGSAPKRRSASVKVIDDGPAFPPIDVAEWRPSIVPEPHEPRWAGHAVRRTLPKAVTEAADRLSLLRALRTAARTMLTTTAQDWVRMGLPESELAEVMEGLSQEFKAAARKKGSQGV